MRQGGITPRRASKRTRCERKAYGVLGGFLSPECNGQGCVEGIACARGIDDGNGDGGKCVLSPDLLHQQGALSSLRNDQLLDALRQQLPAQSRESVGSSGCRPLRRAFAFIEGSHIDPGKIADPNRVAGAGLSIVRPRPATQFHGRKLRSRGVSPGHSSRRCCARSALPPFVHRQRQQVVRRPASSRTMWSHPSRF